MKDIFSQKSKIEPIQFSFEGKGLRINVLREDQLHPVISGNKLRKLKYPILNALNNGTRGILSFGGAYSNHLSALAYCCRIFNLPLICFIRSNQKDLSNPTIDFIRKQGAEIEFLDYLTYRKRDERDFLRKLEQKYHGYEIIREGGKGTEAEKGVGEIVDDRFNAFDRVVLAVGTGTTFLGIKKNLETICTVTGFSAVPQKFLDPEVRADVGLNFEFLFGGYAKSTAELTGFVFNFWEQTGVLLDPIYTGKAMYGLCRKLVELNNFSQHPLFIHTGGLQGYFGMREQYPWVVSALPQELVSKHL